MAVPAVNVQVSDQFGKPSVGDVLNLVFGAGSGNEYQTAEAPKQVTTNAQGVAQVTYTDKANGAANDAVHVTDTSRPSTTAGVFTVEYVSSLTPAAIQAAGGRFIVRGAAAHAYESGMKERVVVIEFDNLQQEMAAHDTPACQEALRALANGADRDIRIVEALGG